MVTNDVHAVFTLVFGSWHGDWDNEDNIMRALLATKTHGLAAAWSGRPHWFMHPMGLGEPLGSAARLTQNNTGLYRNQSNSSAHLVHIALMGDPSLRLLPVAPPASLGGSLAGTSATLGWTPSPDPVLGYHVYRAASASGPFTRLTGALLTGTTFVDVSAPAGATYMVRAVKLETTPSGSYYNASQGLFWTVGGATVPSLDASAPSVALTSPFAGATVSGGAVTVAASATDNVGVVGVQFKLDGNNLGAEDTSAPFSVSWDSTLAANGPHTLSAVARDLAGNRTAAAVVNVNVSNTGAGSSTTFAWIDDALPAGASGSGTGGDTWTWVSSSPAPFSGTKAHQTNLAAGLHEHSFNWASASMPVATGDQLFAYIYLDPANPPAELMLSWQGNNWEHRAYWGADLITCGTNNTASRRYMGPLPATGQWVRLEVPASAVGLEGQSLTGMSFSLSGGRATWDYIGKVSGSGSTTPPPVTDTTAPTVAVSAPASGATVSGGSVSVTANASDTTGVAGVQFKLDGANLGTEDTTAPYSFSWDSTTATNGVHTLSAVACDAAGNTATATNVTVTVSNVVLDTTAPTVSFLAPVNGATVSGGSVIVTANASDNVGVANAEQTSAEVRAADPLAFDTRQDLTKILRDTLNAPTDAITASPQSQAILGQITQALGNPASASPQSQALLGQITSGLNNLATSNPATVRQLATIYDEATRVPTTVNDPTRGTLDPVLGSVIADFQRGGELDPTIKRNLLNDVRSGQASRGNFLGDAAAVVEASQLGAASEARRQQSLTNLLGVQQQASGQDAATRAEQLAREQFRLGTLAAIQQQQFGQDQTISQAELQRLGALTSLQQQQFGQDQTISQADLQRLGTLAGIQQQQFGQDQTISQNDVQRLTTLAGIQQQQFGQDQSLRNENFGQGQQKLANVSAFVLGQPITNQFGSLGAAQQGAVGFTPISGAAGTNLNPTAGQLGATFASQNFGTQANIFGTQANFAAQAGGNPFTSLLGAGLGAIAGAGFASGAGALFPTKKPDVISV